MTEAGWTRNDHAINLYTYVLGYHPDQEALEAGDDKDYNAIKRALEHSYQQGLVAGLAKAVEIIKANTDVKKAIEIIRLHSLAQSAQDGANE